MTTLLNIYIKCISRVVRQHLSICHKNVAWQYILNIVKHLLRAWFLKPFLMLWTTLGQHWSTYVTNANIPQHWSTFAKRWLATPTLDNIDQHWSTSLVCWVGRSGFRQWWHSAVNSLCFTIPGLIKSNNTPLVERNGTEFERL